MSQLTGQSSVFRVSDMLMTFAPWSTAHTTAFAICPSGSTALDPNPTEIESRCAFGATPIMPEVGPVPRPAMRDPTRVPWEASSSIGVWPSAPPLPEKSAPPVTTPWSSGTEPSTPVSMTATVTPCPSVVDQALRMP